jgi:hypothetical protein
VPNIANDDWLVRLRKHLGIVPKIKPERADTMSVRRPTIEADLPLATSSTSSVAGSWERIEVYRRRVERGEQLFHEQDCKLIAMRQSHSHVG